MEETDELLPDAPQRLPGPLLLGLVVLAALVVFFFWQVNGEWARVQRAAPEPPSQAVRSTAAVPPREAANIVPRGDLRPVPVPVPVPAAVPASAARAFCGLGPLKLDAQGRPADPEALYARVRSARLQVLAALTGSGDVNERAAGLFLLSRPSPMERQVTRGDEGAAASASAAAQDAAASTARDALATLAVSSPSPQVYAWALDACGRQRTGACQMLSAEQWARLDPGNAAPWLRVADEARAQRNAAGLDEALYRVSQSRFNDPRTQAALALGTRRLAADAPVLVRAVASLELMAIARPEPRFAPAAVQSCDADAVRDSNRRQSCAAVAELLVQRSLKPKEFEWGIDLGERSGWPSARVQALRDESDALKQRHDELLSATGALTDCAAQERLRQFAVDVGSHGELAAQRRSLAKATDSVAVLARRQREKREAANGQAREP